MRPEIVLVQPGISERDITKDQSMVLGAAAVYLKETIGVEILIGCSAWLGPAEYICADN